MLIYQLIAKTVRRFRPNDAIKTFLPCEEGLVEPLIGPEESLERILNELTGSRRERAPLRMVAIHQIKQRIGWWLVVRPCDTAIEKWIRLLCRVLNSAAAHRIR